MKYFRKIESRPTDDIRQFISNRDPADYALVDIRQPGEYQLGHLPGALLIPLNELRERLGELDPRKTTIVYCSSGIRSCAAVSVLMRAGVLRVLDMEGGIHAWQGMVVEKNPACGVTWFAAAHTGKELIALSWVLEDGMRHFYREMAIRMGRNEDAGIFSELSAAEKYHKDALLKLYRELTDKERGNEFPDNVLHGSPKFKLMEGGMRLDDALSWTQGLETGKIIELAMYLEIGAYDRFLTLRDAFDSEQARQVFGLLAAEERSHLEKLNEEFRKFRELRPG